MREKIINALDIGTNKIFGISGIVKNDNLEIIAKDFRTVGKDIIKKGKITDMEETADVIFEILKSISSQIGERVEWVNIGVGGGFIRSETHSLVKELAFKEK